MQLVRLLVLAVTLAFLGPMMTIRCCFSFFSSSPCLLTLRFRLWVCSRLSHLRSPCSGDLPSPTEDLPADSAPDSQLWPGHFHSTSLHMGRCEQSGDVFLISPVPGLPLVLMVFLTMVSLGSWWPTQCLQTLGSSLLSLPSPPWAACDLWVRPTHWTYGEQPQPLHPVHARV